MRIYHLHGLRDGWQIVHDAIKAKDLMAAKKKFRRRFKRVQFIQLAYVQTLPLATVPEEEQ